MTERPLASPQPLAAARRRARRVLALTLAVGIGLPGALFGAVLVLSPLRHIAPAGWSDGKVFLLHLVVLAVLAVVVVTFGAVISGITVWWEMRVSARMQSRVGYNRVGAAGFLQWVADAVKLMLKEDLVPAEADGVLFRAAPYFVLTGFALTFVALPFGESLIAADLDVGIFYVISVTALVVVGILVAGWASNSKWSLFGGMRSAAQVVSYEIPGRPGGDGAGAHGRNALHAGDHPRPGRLALAVVRAHQPLRRRGLRRLLHLASWPRATAPRSTCPRPSRSWWPATSRSTPASASPSSSWSSSGTCG